MATQKEVLTEIRNFGFYQANIYKNSRSTRGSQEVSPAEKLVEKGVLKLASKTESKNGEDWTITYRFEKADKLG
jgi:hypothetical protein